MHSNQIQDSSPFRPRPEKGPLLNVPPVLGNELVFVIFVSVEANMPKLNICDEIIIEDNKSLNLNIFFIHPV